ncbi:MAG: hypothetical protein COB85_06580, partial [Bacteroidetes bacterium]
SWDFIDTIAGFETTVVGGNLVNYSFSKAATINIKLVITYNSGSKDSVTQAVIINPTPVADFYVADVCWPGATVLWDSSTISSGSITEYKWDFNNDQNIDTISSTPMSFSFDYGTAGTYSAALTVVSDLGCVSKTSKTILLYEKPTTSFIEANTVSGAATSFTDQSSITMGTIDSYYWDFGDGNTSLNKNATNTYLMAGMYEVTLVTVSNNYCSDSLVRPVTIGEAETVVSTEIELLSNVLTPNNDGFNDMLEFSQTGCTVSIFNRWNDMIYSSDSYNNDWSESSLDAGAYYYTIKCPNGEEMGVINIIK